MSEPCRWRRGERYETCVDDGARGSAPNLCMAYSRARCLPSPKGGFRIPGPRRALSGRLVNGSRVDGDDICVSGIIDTIDPTETDKPLTITFAEGH